MKISVVILSFNSEDVIADTINAAKAVSDDIYVVDSFSKDRTVELVKSLGATVVERAFQNYAEQRNWAIDNLPIKHHWQLHVDADEILSEGLIKEIRALANEGEADFDGYFIPRLTKFLGRELWHGGYYPNYHMRLFKSGRGRVEDRKYDQHFMLTGKGKKLTQPLIDDHRMLLTEWTARHNKWSDAEAQEVLNPSTGAQIEADSSGTPMQRQRAKKGMYYRLPLFWRSIAHFLYRYILRAGFLDGVPGLIYCFLQAGWFRFLVDAKIYEINQRAKQG